MEIAEQLKKKITQTELLEERNLGKRFLLVIMKEHQCTLGGIAGIDREIDHIAENRCPEGVRAARTQFQSLILMGGKQVNSMYHTQSLITFRHSSIVSKKSKKLLKPVIFIMSRTSSFMPTRQNCSPLEAATFLE